MATPSTARIIEKHLLAPHTTRAGGVRSERAPGQSEGEKGQQEIVRIEESELHFNGYTNPQGWLPTCYLSVVVAGSAIHGHTPGQPDQSKSACHRNTRAGGALSNTLDCS